MPIKLNSVTDIPNDLLERLKQLRQTFANCEFLEELMEYKEIQEIVYELDNICIQKGVIGFHYTRAIRKEIETYGLILQTGNERRKKFIQHYGYLFTETQIEKIRSYWQEYFGRFQTEVRDNRIWFAFTLLALGNGGAKPLLSYFGGEQIYMPLTQDKEIENILQNIGEPLIVECTLNAKLLTTFSENPWGKVWLSSYHYHVNPESYRHDIDAYQNIAVPPDNLI